MDRVVVVRYLLKIIKHLRNSFHFGGCSFYKVIWPMNLGIYSIILFYESMKFISLNSLLLPTVILPFCRTCIQQMPNMMISQLLVQLIALFDALIIHITKFIMKHR